MVEMAMPAAAGGGAREEGEIRPREDVRKNKKDEAKKPADTTFRAQ